MNAAASLHVATIDSAALALARFLSAIGELRLSDRPISSQSRMGG